MCIAIPSRVVAVDGYVASVECYGVRREASLLFHPETAVGDYVVVQTGHVVERLDPQAARAALALFYTIFASDDAGADPSPSRFQQAGVWRSPLPSLVHMPRLPSWHRRSR